MSIKDTQNWFVEAVPNPTARSLTVQIAVHAEEVAEMFTATTSDDEDTAALIAEVILALETLSAQLKAGATIKVTDRQEFLDGLTDQIVTAVGCGHMTKMDVAEALNRVNASNFSKFVDGKAVFDENGKIKKGPDYFRPNLEGLY